MKKTSKKNTKNKSKKEVTVYDNQDVTHFIDESKPKKLKDFGIEIPAVPPTQVVSIRLPSQLLNVLRAIGSRQDIPYQALIKRYLFEAVEKEENKKAS